MATPAAAEAQHKRDCISCNLGADAAPPPNMESVKAREQSLVIKPCQDLVKTAARMLFDRWLAHCELAERVEGDTTWTSPPFRVTYDASPSTWLNRRDEWRRECDARAMSALREQMNLPPLKGTTTTNKQASPAPMGNAPAFEMSQDTLDEVIRLFREASRPRVVCQTSSAYTDQDANGYSTGAKYAVLCVSWAPDVLTFHKQLFDDSVAAPPSAGKK